MKSMPCMGTCAYVAHSSWSHVSRPHANPFTCLTTCFARRAYLAVLASTSGSEYPLLVDSTTLVFEGVISGFVAGLEQVTFL